MYECCAEVCKLHIRNRMAEVERKRGRQIDLLIVNEEMDNLDNFKESDTSLVKK